MTSEKSLEKRQKIISSALAVFLKYGYNRVTMADIAKASGVSRPALYLLFDTKQDIFNAVFLDSSQKKLAKINQGLGAMKTPMAKMTFIFEVWTVEPFDWACRSDEAREFLDSMFLFAKEALKDGYVKLESVLIPLIETYPKAGLPEGVSAEDIARVLTDASRGFKQTSNSAAELRDKIKKLLSVVFRSKSKKS